MHDKLCLLGRSARDWGSFERRGGIEEKKGKTRERAHKAGAREARGNGGVLPAPVPFRPRIDVHKKLSQRRSLWVARADLGETKGTKEKAHRGVNHPDGLHLLFTLLLALVPSRPAPRRFVRCRRCCLPCALFGAVWASCSGQVRSGQVSTRCPRR